MLSIPQKIKHLHWRSGFGLSPKEWEAIQDQDLDSSIQAMFDKAEKVEALRTDYAKMSAMEFKGLSKEERRKALKKDEQLVLQQNAAWVHRMANPDESAFLEKVCLFWHGHFACITKSSKLAHRQLTTLREHALGNFKELLLAMTKDVSMIRFLNNQQNKKRQPNENFARELLELFTVGRGNYTEQDIKEAARAFTGWSSNTDSDFKFKKHHHDFGTKTFMGKTGNFDGTDIIDIILSRKETATFISRKIYRFFVNGKINDEYVAVLAERFYASGYDIKDLMKYLFSSDWFYEEENIGAKIKSPVELLAGVMRSLNIRFEKPMPTLFIQRALGQVLFKPPNVAGWVGGKNWIDNSTLMLRLNLVAYLFQADDIHFKVKEELDAQKLNKAIRKIKVNINLVPMVSMSENLSEKQIFETLENYLIQVPIGLDLKTMTPFLARDNKGNFTKSLVLRLMSLPEFQVC